MAELQFQISDYDRLGEWAKSGAGDAEQFASDCRRTTTSVSKY